MTELLFSLAAKSDAEDESAFFSCSGCKGLIKFKRAGENDGEQSQGLLLNTGFSGYLEELPPEELLQTMNMNQKTGTLLLDAPQGAATVSFKDGQVMQAQYQQQGDETSLRDIEAFYQILRINAGSFTFSRLLPPSLETAAPIGDFMNLLMEGLQKIDEEDA